MVVSPMCGVARIPSISVDGAAPESVGFHLGASGGCLARCGVNQAEKMMIYAAENNCCGTVVPI
jgi:hypothetical protein